MEKLLDYIIIFMCSSIFLINYGTSKSSVIALCIAISLTCLSIYFNSLTISLLIYILFILLTFPISELTFYLPLICYGFFNEIYMYVILASVFSLYYNLNCFDFLTLSSIIFLMILSGILKFRFDRYASSKEHLEQIKYNLTEYNSRLNSKNRALLDKQDYEISNATLNERNRIAREIHDNVGHILSRSILQIAALSAIVQDELIKSSLKEINDNLTDGMNSIRSSIHNIHEDSVNLKFKLDEIISGYTFCDISFKYNIQDDLPIKARYAIIFIVKEALTNVSKHSNASKVSININQLPAFYKIEISDNGTNYSETNAKHSSGIGTVSMYDRISSLDGTINIMHSNGYSIHITIPFKSK